MRRMLVITAAVVALGSAVSLVFLGGGSPSPEATQSKGGYYSIGPLRLTIETANGEVSTIDVPDSVLMSVELLDGRIGRTSESSHDFSGDMVVRTRRVDELARRDTFDFIEELSQSQFVVQLNDVGLTVQR